MAGISRRDFLIKGSAGAAALSAFAILPAVEGRAGAAEKGEVGRTGHGAATSSLASPASSRSTDTLVAYIPNPRSGEIHYMIGTREIVHKDEALVARMLRDAR